MGAMESWMQPGEINGCIAGQLLTSGQACQVRCATGMRQIVGSGTTSFRCASGTLVKPTLKCEEPHCVIPKFELGSGIQGISSSSMHAQISGGMTFPLCVAGDTLLAQTSC